MEAVLSLLLLREYGAQTCMTQEGGSERIRLLSHRQ